MNTCCSHIAMLLPVVFALSVESSLADDRKSMVAQWDIVIFQDDGKDRLSRLGYRKDKKTGKVSHPRLVVTQDAFQVFRGDGKREERPGLSNCAWKRAVLDPSAKPKTIDLVGYAGKDGQKEKTYLGIYKLDGDRLTICYRETGNDGRPTRFESDGHMNLMVCRRVTSDENGKQ